MKIHPWLPWNTDIFPELYLFVEMKVYWFGASASALAFILSDQLKLTKFAYFLSSTLTCKLYPKRNEKSTGLLY